MKWKNRIQNWAEKNKYEIAGWCICAILIGLSVYGIYTMIPKFQIEKPIAEIELENLNPVVEEEKAIVTLEPVESVTPTPVPSPEPTPTPKIESTPAPVNPPKLVDTEYYPLTDEDRYLVECMVTNEAGNQSYDGKVAVANCILNTCLEGYYTPEKVKEMYGYGSYDIEKFESECLAAYGNTNLSDEVRQAVSQVFDDGKILSDNIFWFYNPSYCYSSFHESMRYQFTIGPHKFFGKW